MTEPAVPPPNAAAVAPVATFPAAAPGAAPAPPPGGPAASTVGPTAPTAPGRRRIRRRWVVLGIVVVLLAVIIGGLAWFFSPQAVMPEATAALSSTPAATYADEPTGLTFTSTLPNVTTGLVLYPGAKVPAEAYAPTARAIAERGYLVVVVPMPLNFAIFDPGAASRVIAAHPEIQQWAVGGHSLGGAMAAQYLGDNPGTAGGLALCGAYSATDLSTRQLLASSVYGSLDAAATKIEDPATQALLPPSTTYERIEGGNHEQCGWYTGQPNDPPATVSRERQQTLIVTAWVKLLEALAAAP
jgi:Alpha/beta hydrolase family